MKDYFINVCCFHLGKTRKILVKQQSNNDNKQLLIDNCYVCVFSSF